MKKAKKSFNIAFSGLIALPPLDGPLSFVSFRINIEAFT